jgi:hypothetical protein
VCEYYTNGAEGCSPAYTAPIHHHHVAGADLVRYAQERARREDHRSPGRYRAAMQAQVSIDWCG